MADDSRMRPAAAACLTMNGAETNAIFTARTVGAIESIGMRHPNELVVVASNGVAHCTCNGEVIEAAFRVPASGPEGSNRTGFGSGTLGS